MGNSNFDYTAFTSFCTFRNLNKRHPLPSSLRPNFTPKFNLINIPTGTPNMSMFGFGRPQPSSAEKIAAAEQEMDLVTDMFNKLTKACLKKCVPHDYREGELNKGESVCIDRCTSKFFEVQMKVSEILQAEAAAKGAGGGGGGLGGFGGM